MFIIGREVRIREMYKHGKGGGHAELRRRRTQSEGSYVGKRTRGGKWKDGDIY